MSFIFGKSVSGSAEPKRGRNSPPREPPSYGLPSSGAPSYGGTSLFTGLMDAESKWQPARPPTPRPGTPRPTHATSILPTGCCNAVQESPPQSPPPPRPPRHPSRTPHPPHPPHPTNGTNPTNSTNITNLTDVADGAATLTDDQQSFRPLPGPVRDARYTSPDGRQRHRTVVPPSRMTTQHIVITLDSDNTSTGLDRKEPKERNSDHNVDLKEGKGRKGSPVHPNVPHSTVDTKVITKVTDTPRSETPPPTRNASTSATTRPLSWGKPAQGAPAVLKPSPPPTAKTPSTPSATPSATQSTEAIPATPILWPQTPTQPRLANATNATNPTIQSGASLDNKHNPTVPTLGVVPRGTVATTTQIVWAPAPTPRVVPYGASEEAKHILGSESIVSQVPYGTHGSAPPRSDNYSVAGTLASLRSFCPPFSLSQSVAQQLWRLPPEPQPQQTQQTQQAQQAQQPEVQTQPQPPSEPQPQSAPTQGPQQPEGSISSFLAGLGFGSGPKQSQEVASGGGGGGGGSGSGGNWRGHACSEYFVVGCDRCDQRKRELRTQEIANLQAEVDRLLAHARTMQQAVSTTSQKVFQLQTALTAERARADEAVERNKTLLATRIGENLSSTQHNLASGFPSNSHLKERYIELMTTGARADLIDAVVQVHDSLLKAYPHFATDAAETTDLGLDVSDDYRLRVEFHVGEMVVEMHGVVASLFAQLPCSLEKVIADALPMRGYNGPALRASWAEEALRESLRANHQSVISYIRNVYHDPQLKAALALNALTAEQGEKLEWSDDKRDEREKIYLQRYLVRRDPLVRFGFERSPGAHAIISYLIESIEIANSDVKAPEIQDAAFAAFDAMEKFAQECLELLWLINLSVPKITLDVSFAKDRHVAHYKQHAVIAHAARKHTMSPGPPPLKSILYPPLVLLADNSVLVQGLAL